LETICPEPRNQHASTSVALAVTKERDVPSIEIPTEHGVQLRWVFTDRQRTKDLKHLTILHGWWKVAAMDEQGRDLDRENIGRGDWVRMDMVLTFRVDQQGDTIRATEVLTTRSTYTHDPSTVVMML
jgi:hypothetical protein